MADCKDDKCGFNVYKGLSAEIISMFYPNREQLGLVIQNRLDRQEDEIAKMINIFVANKLSFKEEK